MTPELTTGLVTLCLSAFISALSWLINRNVRSLDARMQAVETDMRQLAARVGSHGESLASGNTRFQAIEDRVGRNEERLRDLERDCAACQRRGGA